MKVEITKEFADELSSLSIKIFVEVNYLMKRCSGESEYDREVKARQFIRNKIEEVYKKGHSDGFAAATKILIN